MKDDMISRQAALDALGERPVVWSDNDDYTLGERNQYDMDRLAIETVPSAQPNHIGEVTEMVGDTISRQMALKELEDLNIASFYEENEHSKEVYTEVKAMLNALPPAQPDVPDINVGDMISRQAAIDAAQRWSGDHRLKNTAHRSADEGAPAD